MKKILLSTLILLLAQPAAAERIISGVTGKLEAANIQVKEGANAIFRFNLSRSFDFDVRYAYHTEDITAKAGKDYREKQGYVVFPAGKQYAEIRVETLKDNIIDNDHSQLVLSDTETHGYGKVWGRYVWTGWWRIDGLPRTKAVRAKIRNVMSEGTSRQAPDQAKY